MNSIRTIDFYTGSEGEPEVIFKRRGKDGNDREQLRMWDGYFNDIIEQIPPGQDGNWEGVTLYYHTATGWKDLAEWECREIPLFLSQLWAIDPSKFRLKSDVVLQALIEFVNNCSTTGDQLFILED